MTIDSFSPKYGDSLAIVTLAQQFLDATVNKPGTDEKIVDRILKEVHDKGFSERFSEAVSLRLFRASLFYEWGGQERDIVQTQTKNLIPAILTNELSGSQLARAMDLYTQGRETYRSSSREYFLEGLISTVDLSSTPSKVALGVGAAATIGLLLVSPPAAAVVGGLLLLGTAAYGITTLAKNGVELALSDSEAEFKGNMRDLGVGLGITASSVPFTPKAMSGVFWGINDYLSFRFASVGPFSPF